MHRQCQGKEKCWGVGEAACFQFFSSEDGGIHRAQNADLYQKKADSVCV